IEAYRASLDRTRIGLGFTVFVGVRLEAHANDRAGGFEEAVLGMREVIACHMVSGTVDYLLEVVVPDLAHYQKFLLSRLLAWPIEPRNRTSPTKAICDGLCTNTTWPGVWPGQCTTSNVRPPSCTVSPFSSQRSGTNGL